MSCTDYQRQLKYEFKTVKWIWQVNFYTGDRFGNGYCTEIIDEMNVSVIIFDENE